MFSESVKDNNLKVSFITSTSSTTAVGTSIDVNKYDFLILQIRSSDGKTIYGSDIFPMDFIADNTTVDILRYFNVLSGNFTGTLKHISGNSFTINTSNSSYLLEVYGVEK